MYLLRRGGPLLCLDHFRLKIITQYFAWNYIYNNIEFHQLEPIQIFYNTIYWKCTYKIFVKYMQI